jgi:hypothetical protein
MSVVVVVTGTRVVVVVSATNVAVLVFAGKVVTVVPAATVMVQGDAGTVIVSGADVAVETMVVKTSRRVMKEEQNADARSAMMVFLHDDTLLSWSLVPRGASWSLRAARGTRPALMD